MRLVFRTVAWDDFRYWIGADPKMAARLIHLLEDVRRSPFRGIGKPEPLRDNLAGWWARRIDQEHRLVYRVIGKGDDQAIEIAQCRFHYDR